MTENPYSILIVEDNEADSRLYSELLKDNVLYEFETLVVTQLADAVAVAETRKFDAALLDLNLPDSDGIATVVKFVNFSPHVPVIVATGRNEMTTGVEAVQKGAEDFLLKSELTPLSLGRALVYAAERRRLLKEVEQAQLRDEREREIAALTELSDSSNTKVTARSLAIEPFRIAAPEQFERVTSTYAEIIPDALEERKLKVDLNVADRLKQVAELMGGWRCGPRDVVEMHLSAVSEKRQILDNVGNRVAAEETRFLLIEVLGYLVTFYRNMSSFRGKVSN